MELMPLTLSRRNCQPHGMLIVLSQPFPLERREAGGEKLKRRGGRTGSWVVRGVRGVSTF
jgi:hypothetical protein